MEGKVEGKCPVCGSVDLICDKKNMNGYDVYRCNKCGTEPLYYPSGTKPLNVRKLMMEKLDEYKEKATHWR